MKSIAVLPWIALAAAMPLATPDPLQEALATKKVPIGHPIRSLIQHIGAPNNDTKQNVSIVLTPTSCMGGPTEKCAEDLCALHHFVKEDYPCGPLFNAVRKDKPADDKVKEGDRPLPMAATLRLRACEPFRNSSISDRCLRLMCDIARVHEPGRHSCQGRKDRRPAKHRVLKVSGSKTAKRSTVAPVGGEATGGWDDFDLDDMDGGFDDGEPADSENEDAFGLPKKDEAAERRAKADSLLGALARKFAKKLKAERQRDSSKERGSKKEKESNKAKASKTKVVKPDDVVDNNKVRKPGEKWNDFRSMAAKERERAHWRWKLEELSSEGEKPTAEKETTKKEAKKKETEEKEITEKETVENNPSQDDEPDEKTKAKAKPSKAERKKNGKVVLGKFAEQSRVMQEMIRGEDARMCELEPGKKDPKPIPCWMLSYSPQ